MNRFPMFLVPLFVCCHAFAQQDTKTLAELKAAGAQRLDRVAVEKFLSGVNFTVTTGGGSTQQWEVKADQSLAVVSNSWSKAGSRPSNAAGTWTVSDDGRWCAEIRWRTSSEKLCRWVYKAGEKLYRVSSDKDDAIVYELQVTR